MASLEEIKAYMHVALPDAYDLALKALTLHYHDNRDGAAVPEGLNRLVTQLQYARVEEGSEG